MLGARPNINAVVFKFDPISMRIPVKLPEVQGYGAETAIDQDAADGAASALLGLYESLPPNQQAVIALLLEQANDAAS